MADARDILGVAASGGAPERKPEKKERMKRPEGMSREAFALLSGSNPLVTSQLMEGLKKGKKDKLNRPTGRGTVVWRQRPFTNEARTDGLQLVHWTKGFKDANGSVRDAHEGEYQYAKFNKKVSRAWWWWGLGGGRIEGRGAGVRECYKRVSANGAGRGRSSPGCWTRRVAARRCNAHMAAGCLAARRAPAGGAFACHMPRPAPPQPEPRPPSPPASSAPCTATTRRSGPTSSTRPTAAGAERRRTT